MTPSPPSAGLWRGVVGEHGWTLLGRLGGANVFNSPGDGVAADAGGVRHVDGDGAGGLDVLAVLLPWP